MKLLLIVLGILAGGAAIGTRAQAQNYPWCAYYNVGDEAINCGFVTFEQCLATVRGIGGTCAPNQQYRPVAPSRGVHRRSKKH